MENEKTSPIDWSKVLDKIKNGEVKVDKKPIVHDEGKAGGFQAIKGHGRGKYKK